MRVQFFQLLHIHSGFGDRGLSYQVPAWAAAYYMHFKAARKKSDRVVTQDDFYIVLFPPSFSIFSTVSMC